MEIQPDSTSDPRVHSIYEESTRTWQHLVCDPRTRHAIIIDSVLDNSVESHISTTAADKIISLVQQNDYTVDRVLETHSSINCRSAAWYLRQQLREQTGKAPRMSLGKSVSSIQRMFEKKYGIRETQWGEGFDAELADGEVFSLGELGVHIIQLPQTTGNRTAYLIGRNVWVGDQFSVADHEPAREPPSSSSTASSQHSSTTHRLRELPDNFRIFGTREPASFPEAGGKRESTPFVTVKKFLGSGSSETARNESYVARVTSSDTTSIAGCPGWRQKIRYGSRNHSASESIELQIQKV